MIGEPNPKCEWFLNGTPLTTSDRTKVDNSTDNNTRLKTRDAQRPDSGTYRLVATNEHGRDEAEVPVVVLDVPDAPRGPLEANDVTKECATLRWMKPDDDGGSPITHYAVEKLEEGTGRWVPVCLKQSLSRWCAINFSFSVRRNARHESTRQPAHRRQGIQVPSEGRESAGRVQATHHGPFDHCKEPLGRSGQTSGCQSCGLGEGLVSVCCLYNFSPFFLNLFIKFIFKILLLI